MKTLYPQSEIIKYKDFQRAKNKKDSLYIQYINEKDETKKELIGSEFVVAFNEWVNEAEKLNKVAK